MDVTTQGWKNVDGSGDRQCRCGSWTTHWTNYANRQWPSICSVDGCTNRAELGGHVINDNVTGERIIPLCSSCNNRSTSTRFNLKANTTLVPANQSQTCGGW